MISMIGLASRGSLIAVLIALGPITACSSQSANDEPAPLSTEAGAGDAAMRQPDASKPATDGDHDAGQDAKAPDGVGSELPRPAIPFMPTPEEDAIKGRNTNTYNAAIGRPKDTSEETAFLDTVKPAALAMQAKHGAPACVIGAMSAVESGYGFTRTGYLANNLFGLKYWNQNDPSGAKSGITTFLLRGQPDEAFDGSVKVIKDMGEDRKVFDEERRYDNRYFIFPMREDAIQYLVEDRFMGAVLAPFLANYRANIASGMAVIAAASQFIFEIAAPTAPGRTYDKSGNDEFYEVSHMVDGNKVYGGGNYCQLGGTYYRQHIGAAMATHGIAEWCTSP